MKCKIIIDKNRDEEVFVYAHEKTKLVEEIENLVLGNSLELIGYKDREAVKLRPFEVCCFLVEDNRVYAITDEDKLMIKQRLYQLEETLDDSFVKINQSCIANINKIQRFNASFAGALLVVFKNGYSDYVSRRKIKTVKERLGVKL